MKSDKPKRQCTATSTTSGERCRSTPIKGGAVCMKHGGAAPQVRRAAQMRLIELVEPAVAVLAREMARADKSSDRQRAANSILDRAGVPRTVNVPDAEAARDVLLSKLRELRKTPRQMELEREAGNSAEESGDEQ